MFDATVSIDLGASYTKVAYRKRCAPRPGRFVIEEPKILMLDGRPLVPSLAIQTRNKGTPWVFGWEAAKLKPDSTMRVFRNWKADLFRSENDKDSATAVIVAEHFFGWLKEKLEQAGLELGKVQTRIAMPAFKSFDEKALVVASCMEANGWKSPSIHKATEPHANTIGLFSQGRNVVGQTEDGKYSLNYGRMFGHDNLWVKSGHDYVLFHTRSHLVTVVIVDIGAFTTDLAAMTFDVTAEDEMDDGLQRIQEESHALGVIDHLDRPLFTAMAKLHGFAWGEISFREAEMLKQSLYNGKPYSLLTRGAGTVELGQEEDRRQVEDHLEGFADELWKKVSSFLDAEKPDQVYLTGGGAMILPLVEMLKQRLSHRWGAVDAEEKGEGATGRTSWRSWEATGEGLCRLATVLGGASVILQAAAKPIHSGGARPVPRIPSRESATENEVNCHCQGGNKDCRFCGGRGYYTRG